MTDASHSTLIRAIMHTVAYADVFDYPLSAGQIHRYLSGVHMKMEEVECALQDSDLSRVNGWYTLRGHEHLVQIRKRREQISSRLWSHAIHYARVISRLPFVRMITVTGSLAMNNSEADGDIDYMMVTAEHRLWTCRALILVVVRMAKTLGVRLCPNYLITENNLALDDQSLYTAHELAQMVPLFGMNIYNQLQHLNQWVRVYLPNADGHPDLPIPVKGGTSFQLRSALEALSFTRPLSWFEAWERERKIRKLTWQQAASSESSFTANLCKGHLHHHGQETNHRLHERLILLSEETAR